MTSAPLDARDTRLTEQLAAWHWPHRDASRRVVIDGLTWHVQVIGQGPVVWLLHGAGAAGVSWRALVPLLAPSCTLVVPDLPGHAFSGPAPAPWRGLAGTGRAVAALARQLALPPVLAVGHSAGAAVAVQATLDGHWRPEALLGVNAALQPLPGPMQLLAQPLAGWLGGRGWMLGLLARRAAEAAAMDRLVGATGSALDADGLAWYRKLLSRPEHLAGLLAMWTDWDLPALWRALPRLDRPLQLLVSDDDRIVPPRQAEAVCRHLSHGVARHQHQHQHQHQNHQPPIVRLSRRPDGGHLAHELFPGWVAAAVRAGLASN